MTQGENLKFDIVTITPDLAAQWLTKNMRNRPVKRDHISALAAAMTRGEWEVNGDAIRWAEDDVLADGQNRLHAVVLSGCTIRSLVIWGLPVSAHLTMDVGVKRTLADVLALRGEKDAVTLAGALQAYHRDLIGAQLSHSKRDRLTNTQALALLDANPNIRNSISYGRRMAAALRVAPSLATSLHYRLSQIDSMDACVFFERLTVGADLTEGNPIFTLRKMLEREIGAVRKTPPARLHAMWIKAWNAYREGRELRLLRFAPGGASPEQFPEPV